jgi:hypothetical protein
MADLGLFLGDARVSHARPSRERVGWSGKYRETLRDEDPVKKGVSGVSPGQRYPQNRLITQSSKRDRQCETRYDLFSTFWRSQESILF